MGVDMVRAVRGVSLAMAILCNTICYLALYVRRSASKSFGLEDYFVLVALLHLNGYSALAFASTYYGFGHHQEDISDKDMAVWLKMYYATLIYTLITSALVKVSIIVSIVRILPHQTMILAGRAVIAFLILFTITGALVLAFQCNPVRGFWAIDKASASQLETASCYSLGARFGTYKYQAVLMFVTDAVLLVLPIPIALKLQLPPKERFLMLLLFGLGVLACVAAAGRIAALVYTGGTDDETYNSAIPLLCTLIELTIALITISLPSLRFAPLKPPSYSISRPQRKPNRLHYASSHPHTETVYELGVNRSQRRKRGDGILKISEVHTSFHEWRASMLSKPENQDGFTGDNTTGSGRERGIYDAGTRGLGGVRVDVRAEPRY